MFFVKTFKSILLHLEWFSSHFAKLITYYPLTHQVNCLNMNMWPKLSQLNQQQEFCCNYEANFTKVTKQAELTQGFI